ncbi:MAG: hypothetical protein HZB26_12060 [Candidatus Hydrogenedentes bacterium]|nr:hypothetical protein [Candidatus Hydrogenedentota bacterium]
MSDDNLVIGLPAGSLADPARGGNLINLLKHAGFPTKGYDKGGPSSFPINAMLVGWDGRPQEFGSQLALGEIDIAIAGDDWIRERVLEYKYEYQQEIELKKVMSLDRGGVRIVAVNRPDESAVLSEDAWLTRLFSSSPLVSMVSEMPYLALDWLRGKAQALGFGASHDAYAVQKYRTPPRIASGILVYEAWGKTEAKVVNGSVDLGLEITQTGSAIKNYGLNILAELMSSETGIWANPKLRGNAAKLDLARMFLLNLYGSIFAEDKILLMFNVRKEDVPRISEYLQANHLFADEPTVHEGTKFVEFSVAMNTSDKALPLAKVRYELAKLGATHLETIPLDSTIPGLDVVDI